MSYPTSHTTTYGLLRRTQYFIIAFAAVPLLLSLLVYYTSNQHKSRMVDALATSRFLISLDDFLSTMQDAETGQRGYLLTGSQIYLAPYVAAQSSISSRLSDLILLGSEAGIPLSTWTDLKRAEAAKMAELASTIRLYEKDSRAAAVAEVNTNRGKKEMDQIRQIVFRIKRQQAARYENRFIQAQASERDLSIALSCGVFIAAALLFAAFRLSRSYLQQRDADETEIRRLNEELEDRVRERTAMLEARTRESEAHAADLERSNADLVQFASIASHDLQEPLRMIGSYVGMLSLRYGPSLDDTAKTYIEFAVNGARRMQTLVSDLLTYSRAGTQALSRELVPFDRILQRSMENLQVAIQESEAQINYSQLPALQADPVKMVQVVQNLLGNAIKFRRIGIPPQIQVSAERQGWMWRFSVKDNGIGFDPKYGERIFLVFQRLHGTSKYPGNGIGLSICRRIVEHHGGRLWAESALGSGSTFYFTLPRVEIGDSAL